MTTVQKIFKINTPKQSILRRPINQSIEQTEDYATKKVLNTQEGTIEKVPVNNNDITNKAYVDSKIGTSAASDHSSLSNLSYASAGHTGFYSTSAGIFKLDMPDNTEHPFYLGQGAIGYICTNTENGNEYIQLGCAGTSGALVKIELAKTSINNNLNIKNNAYVGDHGTAATDMVVNVCYGTSATPPTANTTTEGALYVQYTA